ncbi:uncharacterized protein TEOVI_000874400 [Trypanosoma equiperdum]|uniref:Uncharacterized protein n=4 Tax=Trypanozoon TaxID=39700 RepID=Q581Q4_TRYB2|nr:hypothetical protein, conserved [Trypanosoma brucei gambiense DAL972]XP_844327.1 hypothetical protein, conserved [Trypanosoma brucei brucei TREU927]AAX79920.1 hypothetical protein, conserved [Trypanosoma brucei]RHW72890.1 hypothetical protein DPX39_040020400 [Trypanosoma brucei equiperdum]SCU68062.1 hypothetical protein, conserved [Trypanosoma equiperdum]AAZ10768.1 hypothetical protein, conserved [Trypanosoma brucei brucei TREU927]CBH10463.1 hypothetical protein, conserved [Trypanosoma bru|eukprot:XP_011772753.1 hypothetical protein, conserved [Trypanosoma brucei gambiense DAL972]
MFRVSRRMLTGGFEGHKPGMENKSLKDKAKGELIKMLKIQLVLVPLVVGWVMIMYPQPSPEEEKRLRAEYEKNAGWKT